MIYRVATLVLALAEDIYLMLARARAIGRLRRLSPWRLVRRPRYRLLPPWRLLRPGRAVTWVGKVGLGRLTSLGAARRVRVRGGHGLRALDRQHPIVISVV